MTSEDITILWYVIFNVIRTEDENEGAYGSVQKSCTVYKLHYTTNLEDTIQYPHFVVLIYRILG